MNEILTLKDFLAYLKANYSAKTAYKFLRNDSIETRTFIDLVDDATALGSYLSKTYGQKNVVGILGETSYEYIVTYLGIVAHNNVAVAIDRNLLLDEICNMIDFSEMRILFISKQYEHYKNTFVTKCKNLQKIYVIEHDFEDVTAYSYNLKYDMKSEDVAQLLFTSGTTDKSKVVMLTHKNILSSTFYTNEGFNGHNNRALSVLPIHHCYEMYFGNLSLLATGVEICINDNMENLIKNMQLFQPTIIAVVPLIANKFAGIAKQIYSQLPPNYLDGKTVSERRKIFEKFHQALGGNLKYMFIGGASISEEILQLIDLTGIIPLQGYGMTETASSCIANEIRRNVLGSIGVPSLQDIHYKIENGELLLKGASVTVGYFKNEEANKEAFTEDGYFRTGDLVRFDEKTNSLYLVGRKKNLIILDNGKNIYPEELEDYVSAIPNVLSNVVYNIGNQLSVIIFIKENDNSTKQQIIDDIEELNAKLPTYKKILNIDFTTKPFPMTTSQKVKRNLVIEEMLNKVETKVDFVIPTSKIEISIYSKVKKLLDIKDEFSIKENLFDLGLDSLSIYDLATDLDLNIQDVYNNKTIEELADFISKRSKERIINHEDNLNNLIETNKNVSFNNSNDNYLITGATGFLGSYILHELIKQNKNISCIVRNIDKLNETYQYYFNEKLPENIEILVGDIRYKDFALNNETYNRLIKRINNVIHSAANVKHIGKFDDFYKTNVEGTLNVIDFCKKSNAMLHHMSTYSVSGIGVVEQTNENITFNEELLNIGQKFEQNVYVHTKYLAEKAILESKKDGLFYKIYRIGSLTWDYNGKFQINESENGLLERLKGLDKCNLYTNKANDLLIDFTKVDECAKAIILLSQNNKTNEIYHLFNHKALSISDISTILNKNYKSVSFDKFIEEVFKYNDKNVAVYCMYTKMAEKSLLLNMDSKKTVIELSNLGFEWSDVTSEYLKLKI